MNAEEVARFLGCSSKTVRRHLEKGTITASRKASGELKISEDQVEILRRVLELEDTSRHVQPTASIGRPERADMSRHVEPDIDTLTARIAQLEHQPEISVLTRELGKLQAKVDVQDARIAELERRITELEGRTVPTQPETSLYRYVTDRIESGSHKHPKQPSDASSTIPDDWMLCSDFFESFSIKETTWRRWVKEGLRGDLIEHEERPLPDGKTGRYFTPTQKEQAIFLLRKHGKLS